MKPAGPVANAGVARTVVSFRVIALSAVARVPASSEHHHADFFEP